MGDEKLPPNWREGFDLHMAHLHHGEPHTHSNCPMLIDVLAEVERLRARNEALEAVAKAAAKLDEWDIGKFMTCEECGHVETDAKEIDAAYCAMSAALSALAEPGKGGATSERQRGVAGDRCEAGNNCGRPGCPECQA